MMKVGRGAPKLRNQILTRQTRSLKSGTLTTDEIAGVATQEAEDGSVSIIWTPESEIILFKEMMDYKLVGIKKHFNVIAVTKLLSKTFGFRVNPEAVWQHVNTFFDTKRLEGTCDSAPFSVEQSDFSLPRSFNSLIAEKKRKQELVKTSPPSSAVGNSTTEKVDKDGATASKEGFVHPTPTSSEYTKEGKKISTKEVVGHKNRLSSSTQSTSSSSPSSSSKGKDTTKVTKDTKDITTTPNPKKDLRFKVNKEAKIREEQQQFNAKDKGFKNKERDAKLMLKRAASTAAFNVSKKRRNY